MAGSPSEFGALLRMRRRTYHLTQRQLAATAGLSLAAIRDLEQGRTRQPSGRTLQRLQSILDLPTTMTQGFRMTVLGPLQAFHRGVSVNLGPARQKAVLGLLALTPNEPVTRHDIIDAVWGADPPRTAVTLVQAYVSRLRQKLPAMERNGVGIATFGQRSYVFRADVDHIDLLTFRDNVTQARAAQSGAHYLAALSVFRGKVISDVDALRQHPEVWAIQAELIAVAIECADLPLTEQHRTALLPYLRAIASVEPLHGALHARLMRLLVQNGQRAAALDIFQTISHRLAAELGVDPDPELVVAHQQVLQHGS